MNYFWHHYVESAIIQCCLGFGGINLTGQIHDMEHQLRVSMRMGVPFSYVLSNGLSLSADAQSVRLEAHFDLLLVESRNFGARHELFAKFREVKLHRCEQLRFR